MASVFRPTYTKKIPAGAKPITEIDPASGRETTYYKIKRKGKTIKVPLNKDGTRIVLETDKWYAQWTLPNGEVMRCPGYTDRQATQQLAAKKEGEAARCEEGLIEPHAEERQQPLDTHLTAYRRHLAAEGDTPEYVALVNGRLTALFAGCSFTTLRDLSRDSARTAVENWLDGQRRGDGDALPPLEKGKELYTLAEATAALKMEAGALREAVKRKRLVAVGWGRKRRFPHATVEALRSSRPGGIGTQTANYYLKHLKSFCGWLGAKLPSNPFTIMKPGNERIERRHDRRELTAVELEKVLAAARGSAKSFRGLTGEDRFHLYATACATGFRASALASLTPEHFELDGGTAVVTCAARDAKNRKTKVQPLPPDVAELLRAYLKDKPSGQPLWGGTWARDHRGAEMLRIDLDAAGVPYVVQGPDGPEHADFHALRHTYLTLAGRAGIDLRTLQELAGHSRPELTARYSHRRLYDLTGAVEKLPNFLPAPTEKNESAVLAATGTESTPEKLALRLALEKRGELRIASESFAVDGGEEAGGKCKNP